MKSEIQALPTDKDADKPENVKKIDEAYESLNKKISTLDSHKESIESLETDLELLDAKFKGKDSEIDEMPE